MKLKNDNGKWTKLANLDTETIHHAVDRLITREYGLDHFGWHKNYAVPENAKIGSEFSVEVCRAVGGMTEHNNEYMEFTITE